MLPTIPLPTNLIFLVRKSMKWNASCMYPVCQVFSRLFCETWARRSAKCWQQCRLSHHHNVSSKGGQHCNFLAWKARNWWSSNCELSFITIVPQGFSFLFRFDALMSSICRVCYQQVFLAAYSLSILSLGYSAFTQYLVEQGWTSFQSIPTPTISMSQPV